MNRRLFLAGLAGAVAGLVVVPRTLVVPERRYWALDKTMTGPAGVDFFVGFDDDEVAFARRIDTAGMGTWTDDAFRVFRQAPGLRLDPGYADDEVLTFKTSFVLVWEDESATWERVLNEHPHDGVRRPG